MNRTLLSVAALSVALVTTGSAFAADAAAPATPKPPAQRLLKVATLPTSQAVQDFENNVEVVRNQARAVNELNAQIAKETDAKKKDELIQERETIIKKLTDNNDKMVKAYGFSVTRNYTMDVTSADIYLQVSDEEVAKIEAAAKAEEAKKAAEKAKK